VDPQDGAAARTDDHVAPLTRTAVDVKALVRAQRAVISDLRALPAYQIPLRGLVEKKVIRDFRRVGAAGEVVRADLGLPPP
jgi:hypothetical protein